MAAEPVELEPPPPELHRQLVNAAPHLWAMERLDDRIGKSTLTLETDRAAADVTLAVTPVEFGESMVFDFAPDKYVLPPTMRRSFAIPTFCD